ncbi:hypothetical protein DLAC_05840 [Tieghemostelium lacteum]|uniref:Uncharacterized protein n=1 Tax=Tieghemostelium lacteum TaxID=361077 RepID=A0A151ZGU8_TIELA|nr:hypothetical protein DLAC_05840 [Tieghemostelium lacteum]|eukprot:KYQ93201.1 hypothetical protein DLAC_05840 [Tieghemostelium lacteum]
MFDKKRNKSLKSSSITTTDYKIQRKLISSQFKDESTNEKFNIKSNIRNKLNPILLALSILLKNRVSIEDCLESKEIKDVIDLFQKVLSSATDVDSLDNIRSIIVKSIFKRLDYYVDLKYQNTTTNIVDMDYKFQDWRFKCGDYRFELPEYLFLLFIWKLNLTTTAETLIYNCKYIKSNLLEFYSKLLDSIRIQVNLESVEICQLKSNLFYQLFQLVFRNTKNGINDLQLLIINNLVNYCGYIVDYNYQFRIIQRYLQYLKTILNPTSTSSNEDRIKYLEIFYNLLVSFNIEQVHILLLPQIRELSTLLLRSKFQSGTIGMLNFKLYNILNDNNNSSISISSKVPIDIVSIINSNEYDSLVSVIRDNRIDCNLGEISEKYNFTRISLPILYLMNRDHKTTIQHYFRYIIDNNSKFTLIILWIPYHLSKILIFSNSSQEFNNLLEYWYTQLFSTTKKEFNREELDSLFLNFVYIIHLQLKYKITILESIVKDWSEMVLDKFTIIQGYSIDNGLIRNLKILLNQLNVPINQFQEILQMVYNSSNSQFTVQSLMIKTLNQLTNQMVSDTVDNQSQMEMDNSENSEKVLNYIEFLSFVNGDVLLERMFKSLVKNKGQQTYFIDILFSRVFRYLLPLETMKYFITSLKEFFVIEYSTFSEQNQIEFKQFIESLCKRDSTIVVLLICDFVLPLLNLDQNIKKTVKLLNYQLVVIIQVIINNISNGRIEQSIVTQLLNGVVYKMKLGEIEFYQLQDYYSMLRDIIEIVKVVDPVTDGENGDIVMEEDKYYFKLLGSRFYCDLDWRLQYRIYYYIYNRFDIVDIDLLLQLESIAFPTSNITELFKIQNLFELCSISPIDHCQKVLEYIQFHFTELDKSTQIIMSNRLFKKLLVLSLSMQLPNQPSSHYKFLLTTFLPNLIKFNFIKVDNEDNGNCTHTIASMLYQILKTNLKNGNDNPVYFTKQISQMFQQMFIGTSNIETFSILINIKSIKTLIKYHLDDLVELFFILTLNLLTNLNVSVNNTVLSDPHLKKSKEILNQQIQQLNPQQHQELIQKLTSIVIKINT